MDWINSVSSHFPPVVWNILLGGISVIIGLIIKGILHIMLNLNAKGSSFFLFRSVSRRLASIASFLIPLIVFNLLIPFLKLTRTQQVRLDKFVEVSFIICFASVLMGIVKVVEDYVFHKYDYGKKDNLKERKVRTQLQFIRQVINMMIILITVALILLSFDNLRKIGSGLLTGVGVGGIIIGVAAQKSLSNLLAGFQIAFTQPMRIDDVLVVEGEFGRVEEITLTYVVLNLWDQRRLILPINYFIEKPFQNWTRTSSDLLGTVYLYVDYTLPFDAVRAELNRLLSNSNLWDGRVGALHITDSKPSVVEMRVLVSAQSSGEAFDLRCYIRENLIKYIQSNFPDSLPKQRTELSNYPALASGLST